MWSTPEVIIKVLRAKKSKFPNMEMGFVPLLSTLSTSYNTLHYISHLSSPPTCPFFYWLTQTSPINFPDPYLNQLFVIILTNNIINLFLYHILLIATSRRNLSFSHFFGGQISRLIIMPLISA